MNLEDIVLREKSPSQKYEIQKYQIHKSTKYNGGYHKIPVRAKDLFIIYIMVTIVNNNALYS